MLDYWKPVVHCRRVTLNFRHEGHVVTDEERIRVCEALELSHRECAQVVDSLTTAEQLHQFALNYNPNDGVIPLLAVVRHPRCDAGTATFIYWLFEDLLFDSSLRALTAIKPAEWNCDAVLVVIERRFDSGDLATTEIYFNALEECRCNVVQRNKLVTSGINPSRMTPIGTNLIKRQWLP